MPQVGNPLPEPPYLCFLLLQSRSIPEADSQQSVFPVPLLGFRLREPEDGFPVLQEWQVHAGSIWATGFEGWRESVEVKVWQDSALGKPLEFGSLGPAKGFGRLSILYFAVLHTYLELKQSWDEETEQEFRKYIGSRNQKH